MRQEERRARTRAALLRAAAASFALRGYDGASVDAIAASVHLSKGAVYSHFPTKLDLYLAVLEGLFEQAERRLERVARAAAEGDSPMTAAGRYLGLAGDAEHAALMSELWRTAAMEPYVRQEVERFVERRRAVIASSAVEAGRKPADAIEYAEEVEHLIDAGMLYRRVGDAARDVTA